MYGFHEETEFALAVKEIERALKKAGIYVRHFQQPARIRNYLRITIGTKEEMEALFACLEQYVKC